MQKRVMARVTVVTILAVAMLAFAAPAWADATFVVNSTGDEADADLTDAACDVDAGTPGDQCTLRAAIQEANDATGTDTIHFDVGGGGAQTIAVAGSELTVNGPVVIDGTTQPGYAGTPLIRVDGTGASSTSGLRLSSHTGSTVRGLIITGFDGSGISVSGGGSHTIAGNYIGTDGTADLGNGGAGVAVDGGASSVTIGGTTEADRNVISGNNADGILLSGGTTNTTGMQGNYVGLKADGESALANGGRGVHIINSPNNTVGGTTVADRNVLFGGGSAGVFIEGASASGNKVQGNYIGTDKDGEAGFGGESGVWVTGAPNTTIGGTTAGAGNLISGHSFVGVLVEFASATNAVIQGNKIGTNAAGTSAVPNATGVWIGHWNIPQAASNGAPGVTVGGSGAGAGNVISGNGGNGVFVVASSGAKILGNLVGVAADGSGDLGNGQDGIHLQTDSANATIGGTVSGAGNVISGNTGDGIDISGGSNHVVQGNRVGTNAAGTAAVGNNQGIVLQGGASGSTIGGTASGARNLVSGNNRWGVHLSGAGTSDNKIQGNYIGTRANGTEALGNGSIYDGLFLSGGASDNTIGGTSPAARNVISGNKNSGIAIFDAATTGNVVQGNYIGPDATGSADLGNTAEGIEINGSPGNTIGGTAAGARNVISGNAGNGITITNPAASGNVVQGNYIGTNAAGNAVMRNDATGVALSNISGTVIGGTEEDAGNVISGNGQRGVGVLSGSKNTEIQGNYIGTNASGTSDLGNAAEGIWIEGSSDNTVGGTVAGSRNVVSGNNGQGVAVYGADATGNKVQGNRIGTNAAGTSAVGNSQTGVWISNSAASNLVGGSSEGARNLISGNRYGVIIQVSATGNRVQGNYIGTDYSGENRLGNASVGVWISGAANNLVGGSFDAANRIAFNGASGVYINGGGASVGNAIRSNSIFSNPLLNLDLGAPGDSAANGWVTPNDEDDPDTGANNLQNFPVITSVVRNATADTTTVRGTLNSTPSTAFDLDFFASTEADHSTFDYGPGERYLDTRTVSTNAQGDASFTFTFNGALPFGEVVTATATDPNNNTSEFSKAQKVDDSGVLQFSDASYSVAENGTKATIEVTRTGGAAGQVRVNYATADGTAKAGEDYTATSGTLTFAEGDASETFDVPVTDDARNEPDETLDLKLSTPTDGATLGAREVSQLTITDDDGEPGLSIDDATATEGNAGTTDASFTVRLSAPSGREVMVDYATEDGTARAGRDYETRGGTLTFAPGDTEKTVNVPVDGDTLNEDDESFFVALSGAQGASISDNRGEGTIADDDAGATPNLSVADVTVAEGNAGTTDAVFEVKLSGASGKTVSVDYATTNGTARASMDYAARRGTLTFAPDETEKTVTVRVNGDVLDEDDETFFLDLVDPVSATLANGRATGTITDDDTAPTVLDVTPKGRHVLPNEVVRATFSEAMDPASFDAATTFRLVKKGTGRAVGATLSSPAPDQIVLDPNRPLKRGETYRVFIKGGPDGVKDADGTTLAATEVRQFTVR